MLWITVIHPLDAISGPPPYCENDYYYFFHYYKAMEMARDGYSWSLCGRNRVQTKNKYMLTTSTYRTENYILKTSTKRFEGAAVAPHSYYCSAWLSTFFWPKFSQLEATHGPLLVHYIRCARRCLATPARIPRPEILPLYLLARYTPGTLLTPGTTHTPAHSHTQTRTLTYTNLHTLTHRHATHICILPHTCTL